MKTDPDESTSSNRSPAADEPVQEGYFTVDPSDTLIPRPEKRAWVRFHQSCMETLLVPQSGKRLLDLGSGAGFYGLQLAEKYNLSLFSMDLDLEGLNLLAHQTESDHIFQGTVSEVPIASNSVDYVICNHVLEHVQRDRRVLRETQRILRPEGRAVIGVPLDLGIMPKLMIKLRRWFLPWSRKVNLEKAKPGELQEELVEQYSHVRFYDRKTIRQKVLRAGFEIFGEEGIGFSLPGGLLRYFRHRSSILALSRWVNSWIPDMSGSLLLGVEPGSDHA